MHTITHTLLLPWHIALAARDLPSQPYTKHQLCRQITHIGSIHPLPSLQHQHRPGLAQARIRQLR